jgi:putative transposase
MHYRRASLPGATYFFTVVTERRRPIFKDNATVDLLNVAIAHVKSRHSFIDEALVVLPDHLHALWTLPEGDANFPSRWRLIKEHFTRAYVRVNAPPERNLSRAGKGEQAIWQRRFWEHMIRDDQDFAAHLDYIHFNPVRHGLTERASDWPHSSFSKWVDRDVYEVDWGSVEMLATPALAARYD